MADGPLFGETVDDMAGLLMAPFAAVGKGLLDAPADIFDILVGE